MKRHAHVTRWITLGLVAAAVVSLASTASADHGGRRFKGVDGCFPRDRVVIRCPGGRSRVEANHFVQCWA